jgi:hypothetical protein
VEFDQPQAISRLVYEVEEAVRERTQEVRMESLRMEVERTAKSWFKSTPSAPGGATYQREEQHLNLLQASHLRLDDCSKQERLRHGDAHSAPPLRLSALDRAGLVARWIAGRKMDGECYELPSALL